MPSKKFTYGIAASLMDIILFIVLIILIRIYEWSWWILLWYVIIQVAGFIAFFLYQRFSGSVEKEELDDKKQKHLDISQQQKFVRDFVLHNDDIPDLLESIELKPYTPKQEGTDKLTVDIAVCKRYWENKWLYLALSREEFQVIAYKNYTLDDKEAENKFETEIDKAVLNPQRIVEIDEPMMDYATGQQKIVKKRVPASYLQKEEEKRETKKTEKEEGVEE